MLLASRQIVFDPIQNCAKYSFFVRNVEIVVAQQRDHVIRRQQDKLLVSHHLHDVFRSVFVSGTPEFGHSLGVGECTNAETVGGMQLLFKKVGADLHDVGQLKEKEKISASM